MSSGRNNWKQEEMYVKYHYGIDIPCPNDNQVGRRGGRYSLDMYTLMKHSMNF